MEPPMPLPIELVLNVITCSLPAPDAILDASHPITKTLHSFTLVCRETNRLATRYLRKHCVTLDSEWRLRSYLLAIPNQVKLRDITSMSLAPFEEDIDNLPLCCQVRELLSYTCQTLTKLVIDIRLRTCYPEDDHLNVRSVLKEGFEKLVNLEEFVSTRDELYLATADSLDAVVWTKWPRLKRLALWNVVADEEFWRHVAEHPSLDTLVLSNADALEDVAPKTAYLKYTDRPLKVIICKPGDVRSRVRYPERFDTTVWERDDKMIIVAHPLPPHRGSELLNPTQEYVRAAAESGTLWAWEGEEIAHSDQMSLGR